MIMTSSMNTQQITHHFAWLFILKTHSQSSQAVWQKVMLKRWRESN